MYKQVAGFIVYGLKCNQATL